MLLLFLDSINGNGENDPMATLIQFSCNLKETDIREHESLLPNTCMVDPTGCIPKLLQSIRLEYNCTTDIIRGGFLSDFPDHVYETYTMQSL